ncbi:MAG: helix-turn-helix domain-containing protein [Paracoccaceae bacterium]
MACKGNQLKCAELLGLNRNTLRKKLKNININVAKFKI